MENGLLMQDVFPIENGDIPLLYVCLQEDISFQTTICLKRIPINQSAFHGSCHVRVVIVTHRLLFGPGPCGCAK